MERNLFPLREVIKKPQPSKRKTIDTDKKKRKKWKANPTGLEAVTYIPLTYRNLTEGQIILGCVSEIQKYCMLINLPNQLTGKVPLTKICNAYTKCLKELAEGNKEDSEVVPLKDLFTPGQYVATKIFGFEEVDYGRRVLLSLIPQDIHSDVPASLIEVGQVLTCAVSSVEDHGYIIETGISGVRGAFLPHSAAEGANIVGIGSLLQCIVTRIDGDLNERSLQLYLSTDLNAIKKAAIPSTSAIHLSLLLPGTVVKTHVTQVKDQMIKVALPEQDGVVGNIHLKKPLNVVSQYDKGIDVKATVLYISAISKVVHFTLQENIFLNRHNNADIFHGFKVGDIIKDALVYKVSKGAYLQLKNSCRAFLPPVKGKTFNIGEMVTCRIIKYAYMDNTLIVSTAQKYLEQQILSIQELEVGMLIEGVIKFYNEEGAVVAINATQDGLIPFLMLTDTQLKNPELKYPVGMTVTCRVLKVDAETKRLYLTSRPHFVSLKDDLLVKEYDSSLVGKLGEGYISAINEGGLVVGMFNNVRGFVPKSKAAEESVDNLESLFRKGQVIRFRILEVDPDNCTMILTLKVDGAPPPVTLSVRDIVDGIIKEIKKDAIIVKLKVSDRDAEIPTHHLVDDVSKSALVKSLLKKGDSIGSAVVFECSNDKVILTLKTTIHSWVTNSNKGTQKKLKIDGYYPAVVTDAYPDSLMVRIPVGENNEKLKVLLPDSDLDENDDTPYDILAGQTVWVKCLKHGGKLQLFLSRLSRRKEVLRSIQPLYSYFRDLKAIRHTMLKRGNAVERQLAKIEIGQKYCVMVTKLCDEDIHVRLKNSDICGVIKNENRGPYITVDIGKELFACVINVDYKTKSLEFSSLPHIVRRLHTDKTDRLTVGMKGHCEVLYKHQDYIMVMLNSRMRGLVAYMSPLRIPKFQVGEEIRIVTEFVEDDLALILPQRFVEKGEASVSKNGPYWSLSGSNEIDHGDEIECDTTAAFKAFNKLAQQFIEQETSKQFDDKIQKLVKLQREKQEKAQTKAREAKNKQHFMKKDMKGKVARNYEKAVAQKKAKAQLRKALTVKRGKAMLKEALEEKKGKENIKSLNAKS